MVCYKCVQYYWMVLYVPDVMIVNVAADQMTTLDNLHHAHPMLYLLTIIHSDIAQFAMIFHNSLWYSTSCLRIHCVCCLWINIGCVRTSVWMNDWIQLIVYAISLWSYLDAFESWTKLFNNLWITFFDVYEWSEWWYYGGYYVLVYM